MFKFMLTFLISFSAFAGASPILTGVFCTRNAGVAGSVKQVVVYFDDLKIQNIGDTAVAFYVATMDSDKSLPPTLTSGGVVGLEQENGNYLLRIVLRGPPFTSEIKVPVSYANRTIRYGVPQGSFTGLNGNSCQYFSKRS